jgi:hypothetical protein
MLYEVVVISNTCPRSVEIGRNREKSGQRYIKAKLERLHDVFGGLSFVENPILAEKKAFSSSKKKWQLG